MAKPFLLGVLGGMGPLATLDFQQKLLVFTPAKSDQQHRPNILFPYARACITSLVSRGTFPQLNLAPVNFDALFMSYLQQQKQAGEGAETGLNARQS